MCATFRYGSLEEIYAACPELPAQGNVSILAKPVVGEGFVCKNGIAIQPMEGCDGTTDGAPSDWTVRRYKRFSAGGAGLIWAEAISVVPEGRANPHQLMLTTKNIDMFRNLTDVVREEAIKNGEQPPIIIAQLTQSGRWSRPVDNAKPIRAWINPILDAHQNLPDDYPIVEDQYFASLPEHFAASTRLARKAGFDGVDIKACHLYLYSELLGAFDRPGPYGGSLENRTRLFLESIDAARSEIAGGILASRINLYDGSAARWGVGENLSVDLTEPMWLLDRMWEKGVKLFNITMGTPYYNPHVNRPYCNGGYVPPEDPLTGVARLVNGCAAAQKRLPAAVCLATGLTYLREFAPFIAAGMAERGEAKLFGFGRGAFAYPNLAHDICQKGKMDHDKCCVTCSLCTKIMRAGGRPGCPVRDGEWYLPEYRRVIK